MFKSIYSQIIIGPVALKPEYINGDNVSITFTGEGIYMEDGVVNIPVKLWEQMLNCEEK